MRRKLFNFSYFLLVSQHNTSLGATDRLNAMCRFFSKFPSSNDRWHVRRYLHGNHGKLTSIGTATSSKEKINRLTSTNGLSVETHFCQRGPMAPQPSPNLTVHITTMWWGWMWWRRLKWRLWSSTSFRGCWRRTRRKIRNALVAGAINRSRPCT